VGLEAKTEMCVPYGTEAQVHGSQVASIRLMVRALFAIAIALDSYCGAAALSLEDVAVFEEIDSNHTKKFNEASRNILHANFDRR